MGVGSDASGPCVCQYGVCLRSTGGHAWSWRVDCFRALCFAVVIVASVRAETNPPVHLFTHKRVYLRACPRVGVSTAQTALPMMRGWKLCEAVLTAHLRANLRPHSPIREGRRTGRPRDRHLSPARGFSTGSRRRREVSAEISTRSDGAFFCTPSHLGDVRRLLELDIEMLTKRGCDILSWNVPAWAVTLVGVTS